MSLRTVIPIQGMHCRSCEILVEDEITKIAGVTKAVVSSTKGEAIVYHTAPVTNHVFQNAVTSAGYDLGATKVSQPVNRQDLAVSALIILIGYLLAQNLGLFNLSFASSSTYGNLSVALLIGLTAGFSTCMALVGGLVLGISAKFAEDHPQTTGLQRFTPHLFFNLGRVTSFFVLGGLIGVAGSLFQMSSEFMGLVTIIAAIAMLLVGLQLSNIFPAANRIALTLPKSLGRFFGITKVIDTKYSPLRSALSGALTFFLPCGFTQSMQIFAVTSGSFQTGALTMGLFAIGTLPGLLAIGGLTSFIKGLWAKRFFAFAGLVVILLAFFNFKNGLNLLGIPTLFAKTASQTNATAIKTENGYQIVNMTQTASGYSPNSFTVYKDIPVKWIIDATEPHNCSGSILFNKFGIRQILNLGKNEFTFTPKEVGRFQFSCTMGMYTGYFEVIDKNSQTSVSTTKTTAQASAVNEPAAQRPGGCGCGGGGNGGCGGSYKNNPQLEPVISTKEDNRQLIKTTYTLNSDIVPNIFQVAAGKPVRMEIAVKDSGSGCMSSIMIPGLVDNYRTLQAGQDLVFDFTPSKGEYPITCAMGVPRGKIVAL